MFIAELEHPDFSKYDVSTLRTGIMGNVPIILNTVDYNLAGSICPVEVMKKVMNKLHLKDITICYGQTETSRNEFS